MIVSLTQNELLPIGQFNRTHGVKGELSFSLTKADLFEKLDPEHIFCLMEGLPVPFYIEEYRFKSNTSGFMTLWNVDTEDKAREFVNRTLFLPQSLLEGMEEEEFCVEDLVGYTLWDNDIQEVGIIKEVDCTTSNILLLVEKDGKTYYVPYSNDFFISLEKNLRTIHLNLPEGLLNE